MRREALVAWMLLVVASCSSLRPPPDGSPAPRTGATGTPPAPTTGSRSLPYEDAGPLGAMARTYLRAAPASRLVVEVDWVAGRVPTAGALEHLRRVLAAVADKPGGVVVERGNEIAPAGSSYGAGDIASLERRHRGRHSSGSTATMWVVYLNGSYAKAEGALGVAYSATGAAVFRDRIGDATTALINAAAIERAVVTHEAGHLLALVNIGYRSAIDHEDPDHPGHSKNPESVMYWAVEDVSLGNLLRGGPPDDFDEADRADLEALKRG